jgi:uncharacterized protein
MKRHLGYFYSSFLFTFISVLLAGGIGYYYDGTVIAAAQAAFITFILTLLEVSISFDNAVVNASVLEEMTPAWQKRFIVWGIPIAVFGMRLVFPLIIVSIAVQSGPLAALKLAIFQPNEYAAAMLSVHHEVSAFGGAFLAMVALKYFFDPEKANHWIRHIEAPLAKMGKLEAIEVGICLLVILGTSLIIDSAERVSFLYAGIAGIITYLAVQAVETFLETGSGAKVDLKRAGLGAFIYLEVLDASFSFDGVVGAFAITDNLFIMALGLGAGAMFVRSLTIMMVDKGTLGTYAFLEHGAFYAVFSLAVIMFLNTFVHINEVVTATISVLFILMSIWSSRRLKQKKI